MGDVEIAMIDYRQKRKKVMHRLPYIILAIAAVFVICACSVGIHPHRHVHHRHAHVKVWVPGHFNHHGVWIHEHWKVK
jgi:hypothetical protein